MPLRAALDLFLTSGVTKGGATRWERSWPWPPVPCCAEPRSLYAIAQWGRDQGGATALLLGFSQEKTPCVATLHRVFKGLDVAAFEAEVGNWLANSGVEPDDPLSLDGKTLRGVHGQEIPGVHLVSAYASRAGAVLAQVAAPGKGEELAAAKEVLGQRYP